jgi:hypothetical protein
MRKAKRSDLFPRLIRQVPACGPLNIFLSSKEVWGYLGLSSGVTILKGPVPISASSEEKGRVRLFSNMTLFEHWLGRDDCLVWSVILLVAVLPPGASGSCQALRGYQAACAPLMNILFDNSINMLVVI